MDSESFKVTIRELELSQAPWLTPAIPAIQQVETGRINLRSAQANNLNNNNKKAGGVHLSSQLHGKCK
jgi:hypothetical protein